MAITRPGAGPALWGAVIAAILLHVGAEVLGAPGDVIWDDRHHGPNALADDQAGALLQASGVDLASLAYASLNLPGLYDLVENKIKSVRIYFLICKVSLCTHGIPSRVYDKYSAVHPTPDRTYCIRRCIRMIPIGRNFFRIVGSCSNCIIH